MPKHQIIKVVDLFCGIGGLSHGMKCKGFNIVAGFDIDDSCRYSYESNNESTFYKEDIKELKGEKVSKLFGKSGVKVLAGCAPCQPFSSYAFKLKEKDKNIPMIESMKIVIFKEKKKKNCFIPWI